MTPRRILVCRSADFKVDYSINPWMKPGTSSSSLAIHQWEQLVEIIRGTGVEIVTVEFPADAPQELIWTRDEFILINDRIVLSNFTHDIRKAETPYYEAWFAKNNLRTERAGATLEGGNIILHGGRHYVGVGYRGTAVACKQLERQLGIEIVALEVTSNDFFHIDLALLTIDSENAFYYPPAFTTRSIDTITSQIKNLHELTEAEMTGYCANSIVIGNLVIIQSGNPSFKAKLENLGKQVHEVDVSEFKNIGGGGIHCLTNVLEWE